MIHPFWVNSNLISNRNSNVTLRLDLVFAMDCTGSMGPYIKSATDNIRSIVEEIISSEKSDIHFALVEYRDHPPQVCFKDLNNSLIELSLGGDICSTY